MLSLPLPYSAAIMKWQDASITQQQIQHAQETSGTGAAAPGCVMSCGMLEKRVLVWQFDVFKPTNLMRIGADLVRQASCKSSASSQKHQRQVKNVQNACKRTSTMRMKNIEMQRSRWSTLWAYQKMFHQHLPLFLALIWFSKITRFTLGSLQLVSNWGSIWSLECIGV